MKKHIITISILSLVILALILVPFYLLKSPDINGQVSIIPKLAGRISEVKTVVDIKPYFLGEEGEKTFLVLFNNDMELRPGGGFIGSFGIITVKNGKVIKTETHNSYIVVNEIDKIEPPYPLKETLKIQSLDFRDSNWSPDYKQNAIQALELYDKFSQKNPEYSQDFDGVIAINTDVFLSMLEFTGPIKIEEYPVEFNSKTGHIELEKWVEHDAFKYGANINTRKDIMKQLSKEMLDRIQSLGLQKQLELGEKLFEHMDKKDIMAYSINSDIQNELEDQGWAGQVNQNHDNDYLLVVDANLGSLKSDPYVDKKTYYSVDFSKYDRGVATLKLKYDYILERRNWMLADQYHDYIRIYVPSGATLMNVEGDLVDNVSSFEDLGKQVFAFRTNVQIQSQKEITLTYYLPDQINEKNHDLLYEHQSGADREMISNVKQTF